MEVFVKTIGEIAILAVLLSLNCAKNSATGPGGGHTAWPTVSVGTTLSYSHHIQAELLSKDSLRLGYDSIAVVLRDSATGKVLTAAQVQWFPLMSMGMSQESAPVDNYGNEASADSLFRNGIVFTMPSDSMMSNGGWLLRLRIDDSRYAATGSFNDSVDFTVRVEDVSPSPIVWWKGQDSLSRVGALLAPESPRDGTDTLELFIAREASALSWVADSSWTATVVPTMPAMMMGTPDTFTLAAAGHAHYKGKVNFSMTGAWQLTFAFKQLTGGFVAADSSQYIDVTVK